LVTAGLSSEPLCVVARACYAVETNPLRRRHRGGWCCHEQASVIRSRPVRSLKHSPVHASSSCMSRREQSCAKNSRPAKRKPSSWPAVRRTRQRYCSCAAIDALLELAHHYTCQRRDYPGNAVGPQNDDISPSRLSVLVRSAYGSRDWRRPAVQRSALCRSACYDIKINPLRVVTKEVGRQ
jgi:hypothetical protein